MQRYGKLKVRIFIATQPTDKHGRMHGSWKTLMSRWTERENVEQLVDAFTAANPELLLPRHQIHVTFDTSEDIMY